MTTLVSRTSPAASAVPGSRRGFWLVAYAFAVTMAFSAAPAPLYVLYQAKDGFGPFTVTLVFAVYAVGVLASLFLAYHVSDWAGRFYWCSCPRYWSTCWPRWSS